MGFVELMNAFDACEDECVMMKRTRPLFMLLLRYRRRLMKLGKRADSVLLRSRWSSMVGDYRRKHGNRLMGFDLRLEGEDQWTPHCCRM